MSSDAEVTKTLRKHISHISPLIVIVSVSLSVFAFVFFGQQRPGENKFVSEMASYKDQQLPQVQLIELQSGEDYFKKVKDDDVLLVFSITGCDACEKEMQVFTENAPEIKHGIKIYGVMFEDKKIVEQYAQAHHINFPILLDEGGKLRKELRLKYFPTNLRLKNGTIKEAWFGVESNKEEFLKRINLPQR